MTCDMGSIKISIQIDMGGSWRMLPVSQSLGSLSFTVPAHFLCLILAKSVRAGVFRPLDVREVVGAVSGIWVLGESCYKDLMSGGSRSLTCAINYPAQDANKKCV